MNLFTYKNTTLLFSILLSFKMLGQSYTAPQVYNLPVIDGIATDACWADAEWTELKYDWQAEGVMGIDYTEPVVHEASDDFTGRFKSVWSNDTIYILTEIIDELISDDNDPLDKYWNDDCLEIIIDEDMSGEPHGGGILANHAIAYHMATNGDAVDIDVDNNPKLYNDYINFVVKETSANSNTYIWEAAVPVYTKEFVWGESNNPTRVLEINSEVSLSVAYGDCDGGNRENFFGSVSGGRKSSGRADILGVLGLIKSKTSNINSLSNLSNSDALKAYPNPTAGVVTLVTDSDSHSNKKITVRDLNGRILLDQELIPNQNTIDLRSFPQGIYVLELKDGNTYSYTKIIRSATL